MLRAESELEVLTQNFQLRTNESRWQALSRFSRPLTFLSSFLSSLRMRLHANCSDRNRLLRSPGWWRETNHSISLNWLQLVSIDFNFHLKIIRTKLAKLQFKSTGTLKKHTHKGKREGSQLVVGLNHRTPKGLLALLEQDQRWQLLTEWRGVNPKLFGCLRISRQIAFAKAQIIQCISGNN